MPTIPPVNSSNSKRSRATTRAAVERPAQSKKPTSRPSVKELPKDEPHRTRVTKHGRLLTLLGQPNGASIEEMMQATDWQQHSVRGFLAGTVKRKLGLDLTSSKSDGEVRRYRIVTRRGR
jgi:hypothetical protein